MFGNRFAFTAWKRVDGIDIWEGLLTGRSISDGLIFNEAFYDLLVDLSGTGTTLLLLPARKNRGEHTHRVSLWLVIRGC